jgi:hypothetical protein
MSSFDPKQTLELPSASSVLCSMDNQPDQEALFQIQGPDEDGLRVGLLD